MPAKSDRLAAAILTVAWVPATLLFGFAVFDFVGEGLLLAPFAILVVVLLLIPAPGARMATIGGSLLCSVAAILQGPSLFGPAYKASVATAPVTLVAPLASIVIYAIGATIAFVGAIMDPFSSLKARNVISAGVATAWAGLILSVELPGAHPETIFIFLPGALLLLFASGRIAIAALCQGRKAPKPGA
jgi:hypothetical protein